MILLDEKKNSDIKLKAGTTEKPKAHTFKR